MSISTDSIAGYNMVYIASQVALQDQLNMLMIEGELGREDQIIDPNIKFEKDPASIDGVILAPTLELPPQAVNGERAKLKLEFASGTFSYPEVSKQGDGSFKVTPTEADMKGWTVTLDVDLSLTTYDAEANKDVTPPATRAALARVPNVFSIERLALELGDADFDTVDLKAADTANVTLYNTFLSTFGAWVQAKKGSKNPFILGYPIHQQPSPGVSALTPTFVKHVVMGQWNPPALNYLMMTESQAPPEDSAAGLLHRDPLPRGAQGVLMIARHKILPPILGSILAAVGAPTKGFVPTRPGFVAELKHQGGKLTITVRTRAGEPTLEVSYSFHKAESKSWGHIKVPDPKLKNPFAEKRISIGTTEATLDASWTDTVTFSTGSGSAAEASFNRGAPTISKHSSKSGLIKHLTGAAKKVPGIGKKISNAIDWLEGAVSELSGLADRVFGQFGLDLPTLQLDLDLKLDLDPGNSPPSSVPLILPTGKALLLKDPRFTKAGHLLMTTTYANK